MAIHGHLPIRFQVSPPSIYLGILFVGWTTWVIFPWSLEEISMRFWKMIKKWEALEETEIYWKILDRPWTTASSGICNIMEISLHGKAILVAINSHHHCNLFFNLATKITFLYFPHGATKSFPLDFEHVLNWKYFSLVH